ncbi:MAG: hypothetical protein PHQ75_13795 [Thermoguttaceae bacterium]|nr:hypothetical protein [Thermoguttaceae bacterium]
MRNNYNVRWYDDEFSDAWNDYADDDFFGDERDPDEPSSAERERFLETIAYVHHEQDKHWKSANRWLDKEWEAKVNR